MSDPMLMAYKASLSMEPIVLLDYYVKIITYQAPGGFWRKVTYFEKIPPFQVGDLGPVAAQTLAGKTAMANFDLWDEEFGQWRWFPLDNAQVSLFNPAGVSKWQLKNLTVALDKGIIYRDPTLASTEFCKWEDQAVSMQPMNFSDYALLACRIVAFGFRFHVDPVTPAMESKLSAGAQTFTPIVCAAMAGGGR